MSKASQNLEVGGDRTSDYNAVDDVLRSPIRFIDPRICDLIISVPRELIAFADQGGMHQVDLRNELALFWQRYVKDGEFPVSRTLLDELYTSTFRRKLKDILRAVAKPSRSHSNFPGSTRCKAYKFNFGRPKKAPTYDSVPDSPSDPDVLVPDLVRITIPATWRWDRYERWSEICKRNDWTPCLDLDGRTDWGRPLFNALESALIPNTAETKRLTERGVAKLAVRKRGRVYTPVTNLRKDLRRKILLDGEPTVEIDIGSCYTALLVSQLPEEAAKDRVIEAVRGDWYAQFDDVYAEWFHAQCEAGKGYVDGEGQWMLRLDDDPKHDVKASIKIEYQRQCLFWRDGRDESNPLRVELRRLHPELCRLIESLRQRLTPTELSDVLTRAEGRLVVDDTMSELERAGIKAIPIHDGLVVKSNQADEAREILIGVCEWHLGFQPKVSIKQNQRATAKLLTS